MVAPQGLSSTAITGPSVASSQADRSVVVGESDVRDVPGVLEVVEEVAGARVAVEVQDHVVRLDYRILRQGGRRAFTEIGEHQAQIVLRGIGPGADLVAELRSLCRLFRALPGA